MATMNQRDLIIVGAGVFGTSTAYHYSKSHSQWQSQRVTIIDRTESPPSHAASTDINKIIRADYSSRFYMDLGYEALEAWKTWPELAPYFHQTGWINFNERDYDLSSRIRANFKDRGTDPTQDLELDKVREMFGGIFARTETSDCDGAYWNPDAGWCDAGLATAELMKVAIDNGVQYLTGDVLKLLYKDNAVLGVQLATGEMLTARKVLLCTGAWTSALLSSLEDELQLVNSRRIERQVVAAGVCVAHYALSKDELDQLKEMPVIIYGSSGDCQPPPTRSGGLLKLTNSLALTNRVKLAGGQHISVPPPHDQREVPESLKQETRELMCRRLFPQYTSRAEEYWRICWDSITPSQDHLICRHPDERLSNLFLGVGGSFHSYKFLPVIGRYILRVLEGQSNGEERDKHWQWKDNSSSAQRGAHEKAYPTRDLSSFT